MSEKEKMLAGQLYDPDEKELITRWHKAKQLMREYTQADTTNRALLNKILDDLLGSHGDNVWVSAPVYVDYGENIHLGNNIKLA